MGMYIPVKELIRDFGHDIKVWDADKFKPSKNIAGIPQKVFLTAEEAEVLHEVIYPYSERSQLATYLTGGNQVQIDLIWLSTHRFPKDTIVEVANLNRKFKVVAIANWQDYSDLIVYELKGDDQH